MYWSMQTRGALVFVLTTHRLRANHNVIPPPYTQHIDLMFKALWVRTTAVIQILFSKQSVLTSLLLDVNLTTELVCEGLWAFLSLK